jgi:hypothetical protein
MSRKDSPLETRRRKGNSIKTDLKLREIVNYMQPIYGKTEEELLWNQ